MRKIIFLFNIALLAILFAGCLQVDTTINLKKDGSGTINEKILMSKTFVNMMKEFATAFQDSSTAAEEEFSLFKDDEIIADAKEYGDDVKYVSHEFISNDQWEGYEVVYSFDDISKIRIQPDPDSKMGMSEGEAEVEEPDEYYFFKFKKGDVSELIIDRPPIEFDNDSTSQESSDEDAEGSEDEFGDEAMKMMEGMKINIAINFEGDITNSNATYVEGSTVTLFHMNLGEMMKNKEAFKEFKNKEPENIEEMKEFMEQFPGMKIEIEKPVSVKFK
jgi:hypothetical protein